MCLHEITGYKTLDKDKTIYKVVRINNHGDEISPYQHYNFSKRENILDYDAVETISIRPNFPQKVEYKLGFHCYATIKAAKDEKDSWDFVCTHFEIKRYIIPRGTLVVVGKEYNQMVIVTPILINPRIKANNHA